MAAKSSPGGFVVATVTNPGSFMATITHPTAGTVIAGIGYCVTGQTTKLLAVKEIKSFFIAFHQY